jgi:hypothetical protein
MYVIMFAYLLFQSGKKLIQSTFGQSGAKGL